MNNITLDASTFLIRSVLRGANPPQLKGMDVLIAQKREIRKHSAKIRNKTM
jgi:hypothetical protein